MAATFPGGVVTYTPKAAGATISESHINSVQDELVALEESVIGGYSRGGPLDQYLVGASPGFNVEYNGGAAACEYLAGEGLMVGVSGNYPLRGYYQVLPTALQVNPLSKAKIEMCLSWQVASRSFDAYTGLFFGLLKGDSAYLDQHALGVLLEDDDGMVAYAQACGASYAEATGGFWTSTLTNYWGRLQWQITAPKTLVFTLCNATTGAVVFSETKVITTAGVLNAVLPHVGFRFTSTTVPSSQAVLLQDLHIRVERR